MQDGFSNVEEQEFTGFDDIGAHRAKRQQLNVGLCAGHLRDGLPCRFRLK